MLQWDAYLYEIQKAYDILIGVDCSLAPLNLLSSLVDRVTILVRDVARKEKYLPSPGLL